MTTYRLHFILAVPAADVGHVTVTLNKVDNPSTAEAFMASTDGVFRITDDNGHIDILCRHHVALLQITPEVQP